MSCQVGEAPLADMLYCRRCKNCQKWCRVSAHLIHLVTVELGEQHPVGHTLNLLEAIRLQRSFKEEGDRPVYSRVVLSSSVHLPVGERTASINARI